MGREIRRVPPGWEHPRDERGHFLPLFDEEFEDAASEWLQDCIAWSKGEHEDQDADRSEYPYYWQWAGGPPEAKYYRPAFASEATHYQMYETVSEGTPVSPVFASLAELEQWLVFEGYSRDAARGFCRTGWAPSFLMNVPPNGPGSFIDGVEACALLEGS